MAGSWPDGAEGAETPASRNMCAPLPTRPEDRFSSELRRFDCQTRIKNAFGYATYGFAFSGPHNRSFQLWKRIRSYANSFAPVFSGKLVEAPNGTRIEGSFGPTRFARAFSAIWFVGVASIGGYLAILGSRDLFWGTSNLHGNAYIGIFFPLLLLFFGMLVVSCGKRLGADEEAEIIALLKKVLEISPK